jgi:hypothetical protein
MRMTPPQLACVIHLRASGARSLTRYFLNSRACTVLAEIEDV